VALACSGDNSRPDGADAANDLVDGSLASQILEHPLAELPIPDGPAPYPSDWPQELRFDGRFEARETGSAVQPPASAYTLTLVFDGSASDAADDLAGSLRTRGWEVAVQRTGDSAYFLSFERGPVDAGLASIDSVRGQTAILLNVLLS
jgi:hypothetical protein